jgi:hypothetical protein
MLPKDLLSNGPLPSDRHGSAVDAHSNVRRVDGVGSCCSAPERALPLGALR